MAIVWGGTNPSLLEAMASECFILAHDNIFNRAVLKDNSLYYPNADKVTEMLNDIENICKQHKKTLLMATWRKSRMSILGSTWWTSMRNTSNGCWNRSTTDKWFIFPQITQIITDFIFFACESKSSFTSFASPCRSFR